MSKVKLLYHFQCGAGVVTFCEECEDEDVLNIAKYAVSEITDDFDKSNEWALEHVAKVQQQVREFHNTVP